MRVLVVNAGSSSVKGDLVVDGVQVHSFDGLPAQPPEVDAVGHRIVHGGPELHDPILIDPVVEARLRELVELAPLHQPKSLDGLDAARRLLPDVAHVARASTRPSTPPSRRRRTPMPCPQRGEIVGACGATASTACFTRGPPAAPWSWSRGYGGS